MHLNYNHLRYFWHVAHEGHLTRAAKQLHVSQSALSIQIKTLEDQLGHMLFERRGKRLVLTEAGRLTLDYADKIFKTGNELVNHLSHSVTSNRYVLRVGVIATLSRNFQMQFLDSLLERDDTDLVITSANLKNLLDDLESHELDIILANSIPSKDAKTPWTAHLISDQPLSLVGDPKIKRGKKNLDVLLSEEVLNVPSHKSSIRVSFDAMMEKMGITPDIAAEVDDMAMLRLIARKKKGLTLVPPIVVKDELSSGALVEVKKLPEIRETFYAITLKRQFPNPLLKELLSAYK